MKWKFSLLGSLLFVFTNLFAQYSTDWIRPADNYQKTGSMIARDTSDNVFVTGFVQSQNIYTRKYDKFGNFLWERSSTSGISGNYEKPLWLNADKYNNVFVVGYRYSFSASAGRDYPNAIVVLKYNATGTLLWKKSIAITTLVNNSVGFNLRSEVDNSGNLYIGTVAVTPSGFVLYKINPSGTILYTRNSSVNAPATFASMRLKGNRIVMTASSGNLSAAPVIVWDTAGNVKWNATFLGRGGKDVEIDGSSNVYMLTSYANQVSATSGEDMMIYKINNAGTQLWAKKYDFGGQDFPTRFTAVLNKISVIGYGSVNAGYFDWLTFQISSGGSVIWKSRYNATSGNDEVPAFIAAKANGEVFVTGKGGPVVTDVTGSSYLRFITVKYSSTGVSKWIDSVNIYGGFGVACTLAKDSSLFVLSHANMTAYHFIDHTSMGTCNVPAGLSVSGITGTSATFSWNALAAVNLYHLRYKTSSASTWTVLSTNQNTLNVTGLTAGTVYNYAVEAVCSSGPSGFSASQIFTTVGTGYCTTIGQSTAQEYLSLVWLNGTINSTGNNNGYGDYTNINFPIVRGAIVSGYLSGLVPYPEYENYCIWIDFNHDNDFTDAGEKVVNISSDFTGYIAVNFTVPVNALLGPTRMRVKMQYGGTPVPCGSYARGETEDYTVTIGAPVTRQMEKRQANNIESETESIVAYPNPFVNKVNVRIPISDILATASVYDAAGKNCFSSKLYKLQNELDLSNLKSGIYFLKIIKANGEIQTTRIIKAK